MLSDEEKKAIEMIEHIQECNTLIGYRIEDRTILAKALLNLIEKQSKEMEELKEDSCCVTNCVKRDKEKIFLEDKIKAKIGKRMQKNNNTIHNAKLKHGKDYVYYDDVQEAKEENRICKEILQSLLEKE